MENYKSKEISYKDIKTVGRYFYVKEIPDNGSRETSIYGLNKLEMAIMNVLGDEYFFETLAKDEDLLDIINRIRKEIYGFK